MHSARTGFATHEHQRSALASLFDDANQTLEGLAFKTEHQAIEKLLDRIRSDAFRVLVIGEFKRGKSTLINAMLGQEVLPAFAVPCTAVINEICWGERKKATVFFRSPLPKDAREDLSDLATRHIRAHNNGGLVPPLEIDVDMLEEFVAIGDPAQDHALSVAASPYDRVEIEWPLDLCRNGVRIIDSPGLNEHVSRARITTDFVPNADAVIFVMSCHAIASQSEIEVIEHRIRAAGYEEIFFVVNRIDEIRHRDRERVVQYATDRLAPLTSFGRRGIYFLSARDGLEANEDGDRTKLENSGLPLFLDSLEEFLVHDRGRVKLLQPARELLRRIRVVLEEGLPARRAMLRMDLRELQTRYDDAKPKLQGAERLKHQIVDRADIHRMQLKDDVRRAARRHLERQADAISVWMESFEPDHEFDFLRGSTKGQLQRLAEEFGNETSRRIESENSKWQREELQPLIQNRIAGMMEEVEGPIGDFVDGLDTTMADLSGVARRATTEEARSPVERILAAAGWFLLGGLGSAYVGGAMGFRDMLYSLIPQLAIGIGMIAIGIINPLVFIGVLFGAGVMQGFLRQGAITKQIKRKAAKHLAQSLRENIAAISDGMADRIDEHCSDLVKTLEEGMAIELQSREDEIHHVLEELKQGEDRAAESEQEIDQHERELRRIRDSAEELMLSIQSA